MLMKPATATVHTSGRDTIHACINILENNGTDATDVIGLRMSLEQAGSGEVEEQQP